MTKNFSALWKLWCAYALIVILPFVTFGQSLWQDFAPIDDQILVSHNLMTRGPSVEHLRRAFTTFDPELYIPLTFVSYQIDYAIGGLNPAIYHATNILLHAINALLVTVLLLFLLNRRKGDAVHRPYSPMGLGILAGTIFAVHPMHTEAVVWIAGRKDLLSTMFALLAWWCYARGGKRLYVASLVFFILALLAKVQPLILPIILLAQDLTLEKRPLSGAAKSAAPFVLLSAIFLGIALLGKERIVENTTILTTLFMAPRSVFFLLGTFFFPVWLSVFYPSQAVPSFGEPTTVLSLIGMIGLLTGTWMLRKKMPMLTFGVWMFLIALTPTFITVNKGGEFYLGSDRYIYFASVGILIALAALSERAKDQWMIWSGTALVAVLAIISMVQTRIWDSPQRLFAHALEAAPHSIAARTALATMEKSTGNTAKAISLIREGLQIQDHPRLRLALGSAYAKEGRTDEAAQEFLKAMQQDPRNPEPYYSLGVLDEHFKDLTGAEQKYRKAIDLDPSYVTARNRLGALLMDLKRDEEAEEQFRAALAWNPNTEGVLFNLATILAMQGKDAEALMLLEDAHALAPGEGTITAALEQMRKKE